MSEPLGHHLIITVSGVVHTRECEYGLRSPFRVAWHARTGWRRACGACLPDGVHLHPEYCARCGSRALTEPDEDGYECRACGLRIDQ